MGASVNPIVAGEEARPILATKTLAFTGAAGLGAQGAVPLFTVTGEVLIEKIVAFCTESLAGASATLALGVTGATTLFVAATTATDIDADEFWVDNAPDAAGVAVPAACKDVAISANIIGTVGTADITDGTIRFDVIWRPLSPDGMVVPA